MTPWKATRGTYHGQSIIVDRETGELLGEVRKIVRFRLVEFISYRYGEGSEKERLDSSHLLRIAAQKVYERALADRRIPRS